MDRDRNRDEQIRILSQAAVFEDAFSIDWVMELTGEKALGVLSAMEYGCDKNWLKKSGVGIFKFRHTDRLQAFRKEIRGGTARDLHARALDILSRELPEARGKGEKLTPHLLRIPNDLSGCRLLMEQGSRLHKAGRPDKAKGCYDKAMADLEELAKPHGVNGSRPGRGKTDPDSEQVAGLFIDLTLQYAKIWTASQSYQKAQKTLRRAIALSQKSQRRDLTAMLRLHLAHQELFFGSFEAANGQADLAGEAIETLDSPALAGGLKLFNMFNLYWQGKYTRAFAAYEAYVPTIETPPKNRFDCMAKLIAGHATGLSGNISQGVGMIDTVHQHCTAGKDLGVAAYASLALGSLLGLLNRFDQAALYYEKALDEAEKGQSSRVRVYATLSLAHARFRLGRHREAQSDLMAYLELSRATGFTVVQDPFLLEVGWAIGREKLSPVPGIRLETAMDQARNTPNIFMKGMAEYFRARSLIKAEGAPEEIKDAFGSAMALIRDSGHQIGLARVGLDLARFLKSQADERASVETAAPLVKTLFAIDRQLIPDDFSFLIKGACDRDFLLSEILGLGQKIADMRDPHELLGKIISTVNQITGAERGAIFLADPKGGDLGLEAAKNLTQDQIQSPDFQASMAIIQKTAQKEEGGIFEPRTAAPSSGGMAREGISSLICVPMRMSKRLIGVLYHDNRLFKSVFKESDLQILSYFAAQAAIAIDNARAYQTLETLYQKEREEKKYYEEQFREQLDMGEIVGKSQAMVQVFSLINSVARTDTTVLITGETGVGKELVARALHRHSDRKGAPFIRVNCAALPESLIASELFGHEKGAFTGATKQRIGRFELADGGTLFLDEIGDISPYIQVRLLRVLQTREFERVGSQKTIRSDFRLITATNKDLKKEVAGGRFREDLYYRLNIFPIPIPPLRERPEDIPILVRHFLNKSCERLGKAIHKLPKTEIDALSAYGWPGNIRELENIVERGVILTRDDALIIPRAELRPPEGDGEREAASLADVERRHIIKVLERTRGKINGEDGAATLLGLHPSTLRFRIKKLGIKIRRTPSRV